MKRYFRLLVILVIITSLTIGCTKDTNINKELKTISFAYQDGTPALTAAKLALENETLDEYIGIDYEMVKSPDLLVSKILKEEADIAIVPSNLAAQAFNKGLSYEVVGTSVWGSLYLTSTEDINNIEELKGKEIYSFGKGLTPDLVFTYILNKNGIDPVKDVNISYLNAASEVGPIFLSGKSNLAILAEPLLTTVMMKKEDAKIVFDLNKEWERATGAQNGFPQASLVIKRDLIEINPEFVESFISTYEESRKWAGENKEKLAEYAEKLEISVNKETIEKGILWNNIEIFGIEDCKEEYKIYYNAILDFAPDFIGGKIPDEKLYFEK
ncbi:ABC transporter substrate-binding protein [Tissierella pigra]|uniref:ABC transporter substrate-binding protein n=1 Tax=Tissierella pigra TaxID=2607614 RepID=A0A6N7XHM2_9FIRM|nr:MqnA/MqnD/SBP family protein [Tissierella pigra]MSU01529.1 ABC transporter substrate-binding protein [Tissierella pigra]